VGVLSEWGDDLSEPTVIQVEPRDARSAALSYDGRESPDTLQSLVTLPVPRSSPRVLAPRILSLPEFGRDATYIEMVQPNDCARRICREPAMSQRGDLIWMSTRYALFGHDLEKGVVVRARLRGLWMHSQSPERDAQACSRAFLSEPPSLGP
jgi:hypothetical protein